MAEQMRDQLVEAASIAEQCGRYEEMLDIMIQLIEQEQFGTRLNVVEGRMLGSAFKNVISHKRKSLKTILDLEKRELAVGNSRKVILCGGLRKQVEQEIIKLAHLAVSTGEICVQAAQGNNNELFYWKLIGDNCRYLTGIYREEDREWTMYKNKGIEAYEQAEKFVMDLPVTNSVRIGLGLNKSIFMFEVLNKPELAVKKARMVFESAMSQGETLDDEGKTLLQMIRDNLTIWTSTNKLSSTC